MAEWWYSCQVREAGPAEDGSIYIKLRNASGTVERWFAAVESQRQNMLATALAAIMSGFLVNAQLKSPNEYDTLLRLYLIRKD